MQLVRHPAPLKNGKEVRPEVSLNLDKKVRGQQPDKAIRDPVDVQGKSHNQIDIGSDQGLGLTEA